MFHALRLFLETSAQSCDIIERSYSGNSFLAFQIHFWFLILGKVGEINSTSLHFVSLD